MRLNSTLVCRFWYQYSNINALVAALGIEDPFTKWTRSSFWAPDGLQAQPSCFTSYTMQLYDLLAFLYRFLHISLSFDCDAVLTGPISYFPRPATIANAFR